MNIRISKNKVETGTVVLSMEVAPSVLDQLIGLMIFERRSTLHQDALLGAFISKGIQCIGQTLENDFQATPDAIKALSTKVDDLPAYLFDKTLLFYNDKIYERLDSELISPTETASVIVKNGFVWRDASDRFFYDETDRCVCMKTADLNVLETMYLQDGVIHHLKTNVVDPIKNNTRVRFVISNDCKSASISIWDEKDKTYKVIGEKYFSKPVGDTIYIGVTDVDVQNITLITPKQNEVVYVIED